MSFVAETSESSSCLFIVLFCFCFSLYKLEKMQAMSPRGGGGGGGMEASLLSQDPVYPPLTTPFFDLLTAADGKDMSLEL